jgi:hypothetical protein
LYECVNTPGLWKHETVLITFSLVFDDFGIKYVGKEHAEHLINCLKEKSKFTKIGREIYTAESPSNGIIQNEPWIF